MKKQFEKPEISCIEICDIIATSGEPGTGNGNTGDNHT